MAVSAAASDCHRPAVTCNRYLWMHWKTSKMIFITALAFLLSKDLWVGTWRCQEAVRGGEGEVHCRRACEWRTGRWLD